MRPALPGGWALWPQVLVRGAGFELELLERLREPSASAWLREVAKEPKFREAVRWQNRAAVEDGLDSLLRQPEGATDSRTRKKELLVVRYLQRYCAKNDTIGFFGPVGWAEWTEGEGEFRAGPSLLAARKTCFEPWAAREVVKALQPRWLSKAPVALYGDLKIVKGVVHTADGRRYRLTKEELRALKSGKGEALDTLVREGIVRREFPVAIAHDPFAPLRKVAPRGLKAGLGRFEAAEDPEAAFATLTQGPAKRHEGRTYGGRGIVYEDCRRDVTLSLPPRVLAPLAGPLAQVLDVARWYTFQIGARVARSLLKAFTRRVSLAEFWHQTSPLFDRETPAAVAQTVRAMAKQKTFEAPCPGWPGARHHAPDLMFAAGSPEALLSGAAVPVLTELHPGVNPFTTLSVLATCPARARLERQWSLDFPNPQLSPIPQEDFARSSQDARLARHHFHLDLGQPFASDRLASQVLRAADFTVVKVNGRLEAHHPKLKLDLLAVMERRIRLKAAVAFSLAKPGAHVERQWLGPLLIQRETWRFERAELPFTGEESDRAAKLEAFRVAHRLPDRVFARTPNELKPVYVDFRAPHLAEMLLRLLKPAERVTFTEMFPAKGSLWLQDAEGRRYVSELRTLAVDPKPFEPKAVWSHFS